MPFTPFSKSTKAPSRKALRAKSVEGSPADMAQDSAMAKKSPKKSFTKSFPKR